ncbi:hypothetical protein TNCV_3761331 [Trichonephila clavipes]|nr:hypothetical protein TNCV_3761331 [Trichonephila clavipes]
MGLRRISVPPYVIGWIRHTPVIGPNIWFWISMAVTIVRSYTIGFFFSVKSSQGIGVSRRSDYSNVFSCSFACFLPSGDTTLLRREHSQILHALLKPASRVTVDTLYRRWFALYGNDLNS